MRKWSFLVLLPLVLAAPVPLPAVKGEDSVSVKDALSVIFIGEKTVLAGSKDTVWSSGDGGVNWERYGRTRGIKGEVRAFSRSGDTVFAASSRGIYSSSDGGRDWRRVLRANGMFSVLCSSDSVLAAGENGLSVSSDHGAHWVKARGELSSMPVYDICPGEGGSLYLAAAEGVYRSDDNGGSWEEIAGCGPGIEKEDAGGGEETALEQETGRRTLIAAFPGGGLCLYCRGRVYLMDEEGRQYKEISLQGLSQYPLSSLIAAPGGGLYATDGSGVYVYYPASGTWSVISLPSGIRKINDIALRSPGKLLLLCNSGIFEAGEIPAAAVPPGGRSSPVEEEEPGIREVQDAAVALSDSGQEKIFRWRKQAAARGWLPKVSFSTDRNGTDRWHWESGSSTRWEDDCLRKGEYTQEWSVTLTWDLGDLVWNDAQTSIDVRSKLAAELRQDIIEQVTKAYFERLRVRRELEDMRLEDRKRRFDKEIRLRELTAYLDAMSGGLYSSRKR